MTATEKDPPVILAAPAPHLTKDERHELAALHAAQAHARQLAARPDLTPTLRLKVRRHRADCQLAIVRFWADR